LDDSEEEDDGTPANEWFNEGNQQQSIPLSLSKNHGQTKSKFRPWLWRKTGKLTEIVTASLSNDNILDDK
jgi:hypothetical protein